MTAEARRLGVVAPSVPDERDWDFPVGVGDRPRLAPYFLKTKLPTLQGRQNSCVWNGFPFAIETEAALQQGIDVDISRAFGYQETRAMRGWRNQDTGCFVRDAIEVCRNIGFVSANLMPYNEDDYLTRPQSVANELGINIYAEAERNRTAEFYAVPTAEQALEALASDHVPLFAFSVHTSFRKTADTGEWTPVDGTAQEGAHLVAVAGADEDKGAFLCTNWWKRWGIDHPLAGEAGWERFVGARRYWWLPFEVWESKVVWDQYTIHRVALEQ